MPTRVVNLRKEKCDIKICRKPDNMIPDPPLQGCFGNPFFLKNPEDDIERAKIIKKYEEYFLERIERDLAFRNAVLDLRGKTLGCFCRPKSCHGDIIVNWLETH